MILVVLGAGASFDSVPRFCGKQDDERGISLVNHRPPLADQLFEARPEFVRALSEYPGALRVVPYLRPSGLENWSVENALARLASEAGGPDPARQAQLIDVRLYAQKTIWECTQAWRDRALGESSYGTLFDEVQRYAQKGEDVVAVTFNYDTLLEWALGWNLNPDWTVDMYLGQSVKLFKVHGSLTWVRALPLGAGGDPIRQLREKAVSLLPNSEFQFSLDFTGQWKGQVALPALALPVAGKTDFECPASHLAQLETLLPRVRRALFVGWRGQEQHFLDLLSSNTPEEVETLVVDRDAASATAISNTLRSRGLKWNFVPAAGGFSESIVDGTFVSFLRGDSPVVRNFGQSPAVPNPN